MWYNKQRSNIESDENGIRWKQTQYVVEKHL